VSNTEIAIDAPSPIPLEKNKNNPDLVADDKIERAPGSYFADYVGRELKTTSSLNAFRIGSYRIVCATTTKRCMPLSLIADA
jgi:hypothetical protein